MSMRRLLLVIAITCAACGDDGKSPNDGHLPDSSGDGGGGGDGRKTVATIPATPNRNLDLLFVIDDSPSMADKQMNLINNFPNFVNTLNTLPGGLPDVHIGVITTDMGTSAAEDASPGPQIGSGVGSCSGTGKGGNLRVGTAQVTGSFISDIKQSDGSRIKNYNGTLADAFSAMASVGQAGCGFEQPLAAIKAALSPTNAANAGFLRQDALLGIVLLTDEDDCSARHTSLFGTDTAQLGPLQSFRCTRFGVTCTGGGASSDEMNTVGVKTGCTGTTGGQQMTDVKPFRDFLVGLKGDAQKIVVAAIMGTTTPFEIELRAPPGQGTAIPALAHSCSYQGTMGLEVADPPARLKQFLDMFPNASTLSTICQADQSDALALIGLLVGRGVGTPCITQDLGAMPDCVAVDRIGTTETEIPACGTSPARPCWRLATDAATCPLGGHQALVIDRASPPDPATVTELRCTL